MGRRFYFERLAKLTPAERLALMRESSRMIRRVAEAALRREGATIIAAPGPSPPETGREA